MLVGRSLVAGDRERSDGELVSFNYVLHRHPFLRTAVGVLSWEHPWLVQPVGSLSVAGRVEPEGHRGLPAPPPCPRQTMAPERRVFGSRGVDWREENRKLAAPRWPPLREPAAVSDQCDPPSAQSSGRRPRGLRARRRGAGVRERPGGRLQSQTPTP